MVENVRARGKDCLMDVDLVDGGPCETERLTLDGTFDRPPGRGGRALSLPVRVFLLAIELGIEGPRSVLGVTGMGMLSVEPEESVLISLFEPDSTEDADAARAPGRWRSSGVLSFDMRDPLLTMLVRPFELATLSLPPELA